MTADVCVIGAGMAGLLTALELAERGRAVIVLERDGVGAGDTSATTAHLTTMLDTRYFALSSMHGSEATRLIATSRDGGETFERPFAPEPAIKSPVVQNSLLRMAAQAEANGHE